MQKEHNKIFMLADKLRELLAEREDAARIVKEIDGEIGAVKNSLFKIMKETDTRSFTRGGMTFYIPALCPAPTTVSVRKITGGGADV